MSSVGAWLSLVSGSAGVAAALLLLAVQKRFRGGLLGRGFGILVLAVFVWALSMLQVGAMTLFLPHDLTGIVHHILMALGLGLGLAGSYAFYRMPLG